MFGIRRLRRVAARGLAIWAVHRHFDETIKDIFAQVVTVCKEMGMLGAGKVSIDGTKIKANASVRQSKDVDALNTSQGSHLLRNCSSKQTIVA